MDLLILALIGLALGLSLGLFGGGGGILAIPLLVAAGMSADEAGTTSLIVVGIGAIGGLIPHARAGRVDFQQGIVFGVLGIAGAVAGSVLALRTDDQLQLVAFAGLLVVAGVMMLRKSLGQSADADATGNGAASGHRAPWPLVVITALLVGALTGFFGVGGGFLVVPALVLVLGMSIHRATATALLVIVINSAAAFIPRATEALDPAAVIAVTAGVLVASAAGARWSGNWSRRSLGVGFAMLVLGMSALTVAQASVG